MDYFAMYSGSKLMSQVIEKISDRVHVNNLIIIAHPATNAASAVAHMPNHKFWYADHQEFGT